MLIKKDDIGYCTGGKIKMKINFQVIHILNACQKSKRNIKKVVRKATPNKNLIPSSKLAQKSAGYILAFANASRRE